MEFISGNIFIRQHTLALGQATIGHRHNFDHTTYVVRGSIKIEELEITRIDESGSPLDFKSVREVIKKASDGHNWVLIKANVHHRLTALEDESMYHCIYSHITPQGEIVQDYDGWPKAYA